MIRPPVGEIDPQAQKPDSKSGEAHARIGGRPRAGIIAEDPIRKAIALESAAEGGLDMGTISGGTGAQDQSEAGVIVEDAKGETASAAHQREIAFKIHLPQLVGKLVSEALKGWLWCGITEHPASVTLEDGSDGADGRRFALG